jgi:ketosteroid isomerase-like protein
VPGELVTYHGREGFIDFASRWQEMLGPTPVKLEEAQELADGRLFVVYRQRGTGASSGAGVDVDIVQIHSFDGNLTTGAETFLDASKGRAAAGLDQVSPVGESVEANLALVRRSYEIWNESGVEGSLAEVWAPDIVFHEIPQAADSGAFRGVEAFAAHVRELVELGGHFRIDVRSLEGNGPYVLAGPGSDLRG